MCDSQGNAGGDYAVASAYTTRLAVGAVVSQESGGPVSVLFLLTLDNSEIFSKNREVDLLM